MEYQRDEHRIHLIVYLLVWCPKHRRKVLVGPVAQDCATLIREQCVEMGWKVLDLFIQPDHVHRRTSHDLRQKYTYQLRLPSLWTRSHLSSTAGTVSPQTIQRYSEAQQGV